MPYLEGSLEPQEVDLIREELSNPESAHSSGGTTTARADDGVGVEAVIPDEPFRAWESR